MFNRTLNSHHSYNIGKDNLKHFGKVGIPALIPSVKIGMPNPIGSQPGSIRNLERPKK